jgi:hypothetical protein
VLLVVSLASLVTIGALSARWSRHAG